MPECVSFQTHNGCNYFERLFMFVMRDVESCKTQPSKLSTNNKVETGKAELQ